jgi:hypothetical protein
VSESASCLASARGHVRARLGRNGPGDFFAVHRAAYVLSIAGALGASVAMVVRAVRAGGTDRLAWAALALLEVAIAGGIMKEKGWSAWSS